MVSFLAIYLIWGSTFLAIKVVVMSAPVFITMGFRFVFAAFLLGMFLPFSKGVKYNKKEIINSAFLGILYFVGCQSSVAWAEKYVSSGVASVFIGLIPLWFLVFEVLFYKDRRPKIIAWLGVILGLVGVTVMFGIKDVEAFKNISLLPFIALIFATVIWSFTAILSTKVKRPKNRKLDVAIQMLAGGLFNIIIGMLTHELNDFSPEAFSPLTIGALMYLAIFGSIVTLLAFNYLLDHVKPGLVSTYCYVNPVIALFLGWAILNEELNVRIIFASGLIILGIVLIKLGERKAKKIRMNLNVKTTQAA